MRSLGLLALALSFLVIPVLAAEGDDPSTLAIEAGRLGVMMDQSTEALKLLAPNARDADLDTPEAQRAHAFEELVTAVLRYNLVANEACRRSLVSAKLCSGPFLPAWLKDGAGTDHDGASLRAMIAETSERLMPFWSEMCEKGKKASGDDTFCAVE
ncbi:MAG: hypothetical protein HY243_14905 [Proteobacteria bacterium]|nr:hypothetical protein [Pseudomonadota bacterium]